MTLLQTQFLRIINVVKKQHKFWLLENPDFAIILV
jgi:hypothetical protein